MTAEDLGFGEPEDVAPDTRADSVRRGGFGVLSVGVIIAASVVVPIAVGAGVVWVLTLVLPLLLRGPQ